ncbi:unnamed protein product [Prunus armeniaca]|uniref:Uncharacterized protein n=1 Tax=Prunus armeniaca TaxID=36596 RepID=A0A6J5X5H8_PRUAR|nr:unnamed protein product [Prunus armeniaca]
MSLIRSLDNKSSAASVNPASNSNETKINSDDLSPKSSVQGNKKERTAGGSSSATLTSIPPPYTQILLLSHLISSIMDWFSSIRIQEITMFGNKLQYLVRPRCGIKTQRKAKTSPTVLALEDEGFNERGNLWGCKVYGSYRQLQPTAQMRRNSICMVVLVDLGPRMADLKRLTFTPRLIKP